MRLVAGDITDPASVAALTKDQDAVISAAVVYGAGTDPHSFFTASSRALVDASPARLIVVGLASLAPGPSGGLLMDAPGFPDEFRPFGAAHAAGLDVLRASDVDWLYVSPAGDFDHSGAPAGGYRVAPHGDLADRITSADFAVALVDEAVSPRFHREHLLITGS
ncbi:NAD(P)-dependent oxidoreductase [Amycolatopsis thermophila]|uniref:NADH-flavin reductase n=1 Tax=Amycolatopsis thermophila TaxID=206084 RepID=A0ABU0EWA7_9PSEU|nr:NAD(P)H-binding protein [Amycolatopsis thermophila]MDQ0379543.1 putative NADH-flavin reductase [Amycolatopsis thermophila]